MKNEETTENNTWKAKDIRRTKKNRSRNSNNAKANVRTLEVLTGKRRILTTKSNFIQNAHAQIIHERST